MKSFLSSHTFKVDRKGRISVPADYRVTLAEQNSDGFLAFPSLTDAAIRACASTALDRITAQTDPGSVLCAHAGVACVDFGAGHHPAQFRRRGPGLAAARADGACRDHRAATFAGRLHYFEIWQPERFRAHQAELRDKLRASGGRTPPGA